MHARIYANKDTCSKPAQTLYSFIRLVQYKMLVYTLIAILLHVVQRLFLTYYLQREDPYLSQSKGIKVSGFTSRTTTTINSEQ